MKSHKKMYVLRPGYQYVWSFMVSLCFLRSFSVPFFKQLVVAGQKYINVAALDRLHDCDMTSYYTTLNL